MNNKRKSILDAMKEAINNEYEGNISIAARKWGVPYDNLYKWITGARNPRLETLLEIENSLKFNASSNVTIKEMLGTTESTPVGSVEAGTPVYDMDLPRDASPISRINFPQPYNNADFALKLNIDIPTRMISSGSILGIKKFFQIVPNKLYVLDFPIIGYSFVTIFGLPNKPSLYYRLTTVPTDEREDIPITEEELKQVFVGRVVWVLQVSW